MSNIDTTVPNYGNATTQSVRTNFAAAAVEIDALSARVSTLEQGGAGGATIAMGDNPPGNPTASTMWFCTSDLQTYIWYVDPTGGAFWVPMSNSGGGGGGGATSASAFSAVFSWGNAAVPIGTFDMGVAPSDTTLSAVVARLASGGGSYTVTVVNNGTPVAGLIGLAVNSTTPQTFSAASGSVIAAGNMLQVQVNSVTGTPTGGFVQISGSS
jgi:predicted enzyme related to lactoylglutathione lyase/antitoxin (DNA-binding transcriptional repressor) of toxin-antitoxin stability system